MNFYNDNEAFVCEWVRNLIAEKILPQGAVDERSIKDIHPADLVGYTHCHFFNGIGGWPFALRLAGWPDEREVWCASCPCQPYSAAGKGKGDADERNLWPEMCRLIRECRPPTIFGEQVAAAIGHGWVDGVRTDLEREGYAFGFHVLPACSVGSPNIRQRAFWVADATALRCQGSDGANEQVRGSWEDGGNVGLANTSESERGRGSVHDGGRASVLHAPIGSSTERMANAERSGIRLPGFGADGATPTGMQGADRKRKRVRFDFGASREITDPAIIRIMHECGYWPGCERTREGHHARDCPGRAWGNDPARLANANIPLVCGQPRAGEQSEHEQDGGTRGLADTAGLLGPEYEREPRNELGRQSSPQDAAERGGVGGVANADSQRSRQGNGKLRFERSENAGGAGPWDDFRIIPCKDGKSRRVGRGVQPLAHGIPVQLRPLFAWLGRLGIDASPLTKMARLARRNRTGRLKGYGNAINPFVAAEFVKAFLAIEFEIPK